MSEASEARSSRKRRKVVKESTDQTQEEIELDPPLGPSVEPVETGQTRLTGFLRRKEPRRETEPIETPEGTVTVPESIAAESVRSTSPPPRIVEGGTNPCGTRTVDARRTSGVTDTGPETDPVAGSRRIIRFRRK